MSPSDREKIEQTYTDEHDKLLGYIRRRIPRNYEAEDILQDVFYQLTRGFNELERIENIRAWIYSVTNNRIIDNFRKKKAVSIDSHQPQDNNEAVALSLENLLPDLSSTPEDEQLKEVIWETIDRTLEELPRDQSEVFIMHEFEELKFIEISEITGTPVNTLISRKRYAILELRNRLKYLYKQLKIT